ncbi:MAG: NAD(P)-dependent alcohol dehydrogenase [Rhodospirillales bacterium]|nr:NAD(P)-dependent alcohol dehydrogenase [Rhodospirillales bacterium]
MRVMELRDDWSPDNIKPAERPDPEPGPGEVLLRMRAASLNYRDFVMAHRGYGRRSGTLPLVPLSDGAGEVVAVGSGVSRVAPGDLVCPIFGQTWLSGSFRDELWEGMLGGPRDGVLQEFMVLSEEGVVRAPRHMTPVQAATLPCAAVTAWNALVTQGQVKSGDSVLILGTGGVSLFARLFAKLRGAEVIITSSSGDRLARAQALGANHLVNYAEQPEWAARVRELTAGAGVDHVVEVGGAGTLAQSIRAVRASGTISLIGVLSGGAGSLNLGPVVTRNVRLQGVTVGSREVFEDMAQEMEEHRIVPAIDERTFAFEAVGEAIKAFAEGGHFGKVCASFG